MMEPSLLKKGAQCYSKVHLEGKVEATETEAHHHPLGLKRLVGELFKLKMLKDSQGLSKTLKDSQGLARTLLQAAAHLWETTGWTRTLAA